MRISEEEDIQSQQPRKSLVFFKPVSLLFYASSDSGNMHKHASEKRIRISGGRIMQVKPNHSILQGRVRAIRPETDGWGADVDLLIMRNESPSQDEDFLRPAPGSVLTAFSAEPKNLKEGDTVRVHASLLAGPFGSRTVLESVAPVSDSASFER